MTTIAWDGKTLAGDTQTSWYRARREKVFKLPDGRLFGAAGPVAHAHAVKDWLMCRGTEKPPTCDSFNAILVDGSQLFIIDTTCQITPYDAQPWAIGTGRDFAMAAMHLGKSAVEAVQVAHALDPDTGPETISVSVEQ